MNLSHSTGRSAYDCSSIATVLRISPFSSFTKSMASAFAFFSVVTFVLALVGAAAVAKNDPLAGCRNADRDVRIAGCTEIIARGRRETKRNRITAYVNRGSAYRAKGDF